MQITRSMDIEDEVRKILEPHLTAYCRPLPADFEMPNILITSTGGSSEKTASGKGKVDTFIVTLDARAELEGEAMEYLRTAIGILETGERIHSEVNSLFSWGTDPVRPELAMCSATMMMTAHRETITIE